MESEFWHKIWKDNQIGFHESKVNPLLATHFNKLGLAQSSRMFLPLCGKTLDIEWLLKSGYQVVGVELSELAVEELFDSLDMQPQISKRGELTLYRGDDLHVFVGDIFAFTADVLGSIDAIYDRAALIALSSPMRGRYAKHLCLITQSAKQLLVCLEYDQSLMQGPPFSLTKDEVLSRYSRNYEITRLETREIKGGFKGEIPASETVWLLT